MTRRALTALCLSLVLAAPAFAQSSAGKIAVFMQWPGSSGKAEKSTGQRGLTGLQATSATNYVNAKILNRTGTPFVVFDLADSAGGWSRTMGSTRPAGTADSTWFRSNGFIGQIFVMQSIEANSAPIRFFTDGASQRGTFAASPLAGWSTPTLVFLTGACANNSDSSYVNGIESATAPGGLLYCNLKFHDNGDSVAFFPGAAAFGTPYSYNLEPSQSALVTRLVDIDTLTAAGNGVAAWRYKSNVYYVSASTGMSPMWSLYGISTLFRAANNYVPRRKLNVHWSLDHVYPRSGTTWAAATSDSFFAYVRAMDLHFSGLYTGGRLASSTGNGSGQDNTNTVYRESQWNTFTDRQGLSYFYGMPHSHRTGLGFTVAGAAANVDLTSFSDTATTRGYFNMMERALSDTMRVRVAKGYTKTIGMPNNTLFYPWVYILAQNGYTDARVSSNDSTGHRANLRVGTRVLSGPAFSVTSSPTTNWGYAPPSPWWFGDPTDRTGRRGVWIHEEFTPFNGPSDGSTDSTWAQALSLSPGNGGNGYSAYWLAGWARAAVFDTDFYFHPQENLIGASNGDQIVNLQMRRTLYFYSRVSNLVSQEPTYRPREIR